MKLVKIFEEFIKISDYKEWVKHANKKFYDKMGENFKLFKDHDRNFNRIYFDLKIDPSRFQIQIPDELSDFMRWYGYPILDYGKGITRGKDGREIKIGKLLTNLGEEKLLKVYSDSKTNTLKDSSDLQIVISRHPYDIIGMSTNRGFTTCQDLNDTRYGGRHLYGIRNNLEKGCLIAYLIRKNDRNINNPISRCLVKRDYYNNLGPDSHIYGTAVPEIKEFLSKWCEEINKIY